MNTIGRRVRSWLFSNTHKSVDEERFFGSPVFRDPRDNEWG